MQKTVLRTPEVLVLLEKQDQLEEQGQQDQLVLLDQLEEQGQQDQLDQLVLPDQQVHVVLEQQEYQEL